MFRNITIDGLRGVIDMTLEDFKGVNLIVGKNNSGKTTVLEGLFLLSAPASPMVIQVNSLRRLVSEEKPWNILFHNLNTRKPIRLDGEARIGDADEFRRLLVKPKTASKKGIEITKSGNVLAQGNALRDQAEIEFRNLTMEFTYQRGADLPHQLTTDLIDTGDTYQVFSSAPDYEEPLSSSFIRQSQLGNLGDEFHRVKIRKQADRIESVLRSIEPSLREISLGSNGNLFCDVGLDQFIPIHVMGDGFIKLLAVILGIYRMQNGIVLIDEIENGFHHTSLRILWDAVFKAADEFNVQLFATTHSLECVKAFGASYKAYTEAEERSPVETDAIRLYRVNKNSERAKVVTYDTRLLLDSLESDWELR